MPLRVSSDDAQPLPHVTPLVGACTAVTVQLVACVRRAVDTVA